jgi:hypothetical protein
MNKTQEQIDALEERVAKLEHALSSAQETGTFTAKKKRSSAKEFLMTKNLKSETQKVLALGYFLEYTENMEAFNVSDLELAFRSAKEKLPKNMNDAVNKNISRGFLMEAAGKKNAKKAWCLTATGEKYLAEELNTKR